MFISGHGKLRYIWDFQLEVTRRQQIYMALAFPAASSQCSLGYLLLSPFEIEEFILGSGRSLVKKREDPHVDFLRFQLVHVLNYTYGFA